MTTFGDAVRGIQQLLTMQGKIDRLEVAVTTVATDLSALATNVQLIDRRVARIEGFIEGAAAANPRRARLPRT